MMKIGFDNEMQKILSGMVGKTLTSYTCGDEGDSGLIYGNFRLNFAVGSVEIRNEQKARDFFEESEDISGFSCQVVSDEVPFEPMAVAEVHTLPIQDEITEVRLVTDEIESDQGKFKGQFDMSLILVMKHHTLMFSRGVWFSEAIWVENEETAQKLISVDQVRDSLSNDGEYAVQVQRLETTL